MLVWVTNYIAQFHHHWQVFHYLTLRAVLAALTAMMITIFLGPRMIRFLQMKKVGQPIRDDGPQTHLKKSGTPTMGGILILLGIFSGSLLWADLNNRFVWVVLFVMAGFSIIGAIDDYDKLTARSSKGMSAKLKYFWLSLIGLTAVIGLYMMAKSSTETELFIPFLKHVSFNLGGFFILLSYFVIVGASNAVNLTDGLDGLAILPCILLAGALGVFAYVIGNLHISNYLLMPYIPGVGELTVICAAIAGAGLGFLWFNTYPAEVFMGDVGSLALGGGLGCIAVIVRQEIVFFIMSGVFVMETVSVILQVASYKLRKKRIFRMAPIHHHFELKGWPEPKVIVRFWIITVILVLIGLSTLKLR